MNIKYEIDNIFGDDFVLKDVATGERQKITRILLQKNFIYAYCYTCHSKQGCSIDDDMVIYDWSLWCCCSNWFLDGNYESKGFKQSEVLQIWYR